MKEDLAMSDNLIKESAKHGSTFHGCAPAQALRADRETPLFGVPLARLASRSLQALRAAELPLPAWARTWTEILPNRQPLGGTATKRVCAGSLSRAGQPVPGQLPAGEGDPQGDLPHQLRTPSSPRATVGRQHVWQRIAVWNWPDRSAPGRHAGGQYDRSVSSGRCLPFFIRGGVR